MPSGNGHQSHIAAYEKRILRRADRLYALGRVEEADKLLYDHTPPPRCTSSRWSQRGSVRCVLLANHDGDHSYA